MSRLYKTGGMERIICEKANAFAEQYGYEVSIITAHQKGRPTAFPLSSKVALYDIGWNYHLPIYHHKLHRLLCSLKPDITISLCGGDIDHLVECPDGSVKMAEFHFSHDKYYFRPGRGPIHKLIAGYKTRKLETAVRKMSKFVVLTDKDKAVWDKITGNAVRIYNFTNIPAENISNTRSKHCISLGRLAPQKNFSELLDAWNIVAKRHPDWVLDIYGGGHERKPLLKKIESEGLDGKVELHAPVKNVREKFAESSIFLLSSLYEGLPLSLIEAASAGLPIVCYDCPCGPSDIVEDGKTGFLVPLHDIEGFADRVCCLIESEQLRESFSQAAVLTLNKFRKDDILEQWDDLFKSLVLERK